MGRRPDQNLPSDGSYYFEMVSHPLARATLKDVRAYRLPDPHDPGRTEGLRKGVLTIRKETDKAIFAKLSEFRMGAIVVAARHATVDVRSDR